MSITWRLVMSIIPGVDERLREIDQPLQGISAIVSVIGFLSKPIGLDARGL